MADWNLSHVSFPEEAIRGRNRGSDPEGQSHGVARALSWRTPAVRGFTWYYLPH